ncbi:MAG: peptide chain release factor N(5)-glutamine methyltransferase [Sphingobacteriaceae bacterium]
MNWAQLEKDFIAELAALYEEAEAKNIFFLMVKQVTGWGKAHYLLNKQEEIPLSRDEKMKAILIVLQSGKPIQYILGETEFFGLRFKVNPSVLIPRPETEELVQWILDSLPSDGEVALLDIGTGSGCIPIALKHQLPQAKIFALDISETALATAKMNAEANRTAIQFIQQDILNPSDDLFAEKLDVIVSNPPYVRVAEQSLMRSNVLAFEPHTALFVPDDDALIFYERIADFALKNLKPGGLLFFEINEYLGEQTVELIDHKGFKNIELRKDFLGRDRMVKAFKL